jgi:hypothetical protein
LLLKSDSASDYKTNAESRMRGENQEGRQEQGSFNMARRHLDEIKLREKEKFRDVRTGRTDGHNDGRTAEE